MKYSIQILFDKFKCHKDSPTILLIFFALHVAMEEIKKPNTDFTLQKIEKRL